MAQDFGHLIDQGTDDRRAFVAAAAFAARLDEAVARTPSAITVFIPGALRREAAACAAMEGFLVRQEYLSRVLSDRDATNVDRGTRLAADIHAALSIAASWLDAGPAQDEVVAVFMAADASSGRLVRPDTQWSIEEDASWLSNELAGFSETAEPWTAMETLRRIWTSGRFFGTSRRMAAIAAPWVLKRGFGCAGALYGIAGKAGKDPEGLREASQDGESWSVKMAVAATAAFRDEYGLLADSLAARTSLLALCPPGRSSSSVEAAIDFCFSNPVFTSKHLADRLGLTARGAKVVLDKLVESGVLAVDTGSRNRKYVCRRIM